MLGRTVVFDHPRKGKLACEVVKVIPAGTQLTDREMVLYAGVGPGNVNFQLIRGPAKVDRLVLKPMSRGGYLIASAKMVTRTMSGGGPFQAMCGRIDASDPHDVAKTEYVQDEYDGMATPCPQLKCECGAESVGVDKHADYCPKYIKD